MIKVLVVEDNKDKLFIIVSTLKSHGVFEENITVSRYVSDAVENLGLHHFDLLILDLNLPIKKSSLTPRNDAGVSILKKLECNELNVPTSVIGLTSFTDLRERFSESFRALDFNLYDTFLSDEWMNALVRKISWLDRSKHSQLTRPKTKVVITLHGINTAGEWQKKLSSFIGGSDQIICKHYKYIHKSPLLLLVPLIRDRIVLNFISDYKALVREFPNSDFYFFAHSFGTYVLAEALKELDSVNVPNIKVIALAGSVLNRDFIWSSIKSKFNIDAIFNDCGVNDIPLIFSYLLAPGLGMAGRTGFYGFEDGAVINRFFDGGHSFFEQSSEFYAEYWIPLLDLKSSHLLKCNNSVKPSRAIEVILNSIKIMSLPFIFMAFMFVV